MSDTEQCSGPTCGAQIRMRYTEKGGRMPLDAEPTELTGAGVYVLVGEGRCEKFMPIIHGADRPRYLTHFATCPDRDRFKRTKP